MASAPSQRLVTFDPSIQGLSAAVGDVVQHSGGDLAWVKTGTGATDWSPFPGTSSGGTSDGVTIQGVGTAGDPFALAASYKAKLDGLPSNWFAATLNFIETQIAALNTPVWTAEMTPNPGGAEIEIGGALGSGATSLLTTSPGGVLKVSSGATASSSQLARNKNGTASPANIIMPNMKTGSWAVVTRAKIVALHATADLYLCAISDETVLSTYFGVHGATSQTNLVLVTTAPHDLGVALTIGTYLDYLMIADGTHIQPYLGDGTGKNYAACGSPQDQSVLPTNAGHWITTSPNNGTASNAEHHIDKVMAVCTSPS